LNSNDPALDALQALDAAIETTLEELSSARERIGWLHAQRQAGRDWREIAENAERPFVVETITAALDRLSVTGSCFRRAQARALHRSGLSMDSVASMFGVTRQRVSALLREAE
jgi:hypothetical protein